MQSQHYFRMHYLFHKELSELYVAKALRFLALSMVGIFIPIFLYIEINLNLSQVIYFYMLETLVFLIMAFVAATLMARLGAKHLILSSVPFLLLMFVFLQMLETYPALYLIPAILAGMNYAFFWVPFHTEFAKYSDHKHRGREFAFMQTLSILATVVGPVIGGLIITFFDFLTLFVIVGILLFASALPLFLSPELYAKYKLNYKNLFDSFFLKYGLSFFAEGVKGMTSTLAWPLFIFLILDGFISFGAVSTLSAFAMAAVTLYIGKLTDQLKKKRMIAVGAGLMSMLWFVRTLVQFPLEVFLIGFLGGILEAFFHIPYMAKFYNKTKKIGILDFVIFRETMLRLGALSVLFLLLITQNYISTFVLTGLTAWVHILL